MFRPVLAAALALGLAAPAAACRCPPRDAKAAARAADAVALGTVTAAHDVGQDTGRVERRYEVRVSRAWKATLPATITVDSGTTCLYDMAIGSEQLLYLKRDGAGWRTGICSANRSGAAIAAGVAALGRAKVAAGRASPCEERPS